MNFNVPFWRMLYSRAKPKLNRAILCVVTRTDCCQTPALGLLTYCFVYLHTSFYRIPKEKKCDSKLLFPYAQRTGTLGSNMKLFFSGLMFTMASLNFHVAFLLALFGAGEFSVYYSKVKRNNITI